MRISARKNELAESLTNIYRPPETERNRAHWRINGFPASVVIWTIEEWEQMVDRPTDAQYFPCGVWCALRLED